MVVDIPKTFGALLLGGLFASLLSGFVVIQVVVYFKLYPQDPRPLKGLVLLVWLLDTSHTACVWLSLWHYLILNYGVPGDIENIATSLAMSVLITALLTALVHMFYARRIFLLSKRNFFLTMPVVILAILRLVSALATTALMVKLRNFATFRANVRWVATTGLALPPAVDVLITLTLFALLQTSRTGAEKSNAVIDALITYTFETGALTSAGTVTTLICWLAMPNLIFMALHFVTGKLYANSLLITLNTREDTRNLMLRHGRSNGHSSEHAHSPAHFIDPRRHGLRDSESDDLVISGVRSDSKAQQLEVTVERSVQYG